MTTARIDAPLSSLALTTALASVIGLLAACGPGVAYTPLPATRENAEAALRAEATLDYPRLKGAIGPHGLLVFCQADREVVLVEPRIQDDSVCGRPWGLRDDGDTGPGAERCWNTSQMNAIGLPRDKPQIAMYHLRDTLNCGTRK